MQAVPSAELACCSLARSPWWRPGQLGTAPLASVSVSSLTSLAQVLK